MGVSVQGRGPFDRIRDAIHHNWKDITDGFKCRGGSKFDNGNIL